MQDQQADVPGVVTALTVRGMTCGGCVRSVTQALARALPAAAATVDLASGRVTFAAPVAADVAKRAVTAAGFEVVG